MADKAQFFLLGTSSAPPMAKRDNTSLLVRLGGELTLIDCSASPMQKILRLGLDPMDLKRVIVTHAHVDHVYGFPSLLHSLWTYRPPRREPLSVLAPPESCTLLEELARLFDFRREGKLPFELRIEELDLWEKHLAVEAETYRVTVSPVSHGDAEVVALRFEDSSGRSLAYSSDTEPCESLVHLALEADTLVMEATRAPGEDLRGHSSGEEAGEIAARARAKRLILVHIAAKTPDEEECLLQRAQKTFGPGVEIGREMIPYTL